MRLTFLQPYPMAIAEHSIFTHLPFREMINRLEFFLIGKGI
jgi:hypothetical protein